MSSNKTKLSSDAQNALKKFELENEIITEEELYFFDEKEVDKLFE